MSRARLILFIYSLFLLIGGSIGYLISGSIVSLVTSLIFFFLLILSHYLLSIRLFWGKSLAYLCMSILSIFFILRWISTQKFMPAGLMSIVTVLAFAFLLHKLERKVE